MLENFEFTKTRFLAVEGIDEKNFLEKLLEKEALCLNY
jgi:hypothetical protein